MPRPTQRRRARRRRLLGVAACALGLGVMTAAGCGGSSAVAVTSGPDAGTDAVGTGDALAADGSSSGDGASTDGSRRDATDGPAGKAKRVFFTYHVYKISAFGGLDGADTLCQAAGDSISLGGTFRAWLSSDLESASMHLSHGTGPYVTLANEVVASSWTELTSGTLQHAIDRTEQGLVPQTAMGCGFGAVWTGTLANGNPFPGGTCSGWTDTSTDATLGSAIGKNNEWTNACSSTCAGTASLYCVEQ